MKHSPGKHLPALVTAAASFGPAATFMPVSERQYLPLPLKECSREKDRCVSLTCEHDGVLDAEELRQRSLEDLGRRRHFVFKSYDDGGSKVSRGRACLVLCLNSSSGPWVLTVIAGLV